MTASAVAPAAPLRLAADLALPLDAVTQTFAILAKRGAGKTYTAAVLVEELLGAGAQVVAVDPVGVWWGLRVAANGAGPGLPIVVFGGDHGDLPLGAEQGETIATLIVEEGIAAVLDLSLLRKGEQGRFMTAFAEALYHRNRRPLHLVLDEADAYAPQRPLPGQQRLLGAIEDIVRRGRARGLGVTLVTQRAAVLNKDVLTQAEVLIALRTIAPQDRAAIDAWVKVHGTPEQQATLQASLPSLPIGTAWIWSPGWLDLFQRVAIRRRTTYDSSATPQVGHTPTPAPQLAPVDLSRLRARLAMPTDDPGKDTVAALRRQVAGLQAELIALRAAPPRVEPVEVPVLTDAQIGTLGDLAQQLARQGQELLTFGRTLLAAVDRARADIQPPGLPPPWDMNPPDLPMAPLPAAEEITLRKGERHILALLAQRHPTRLTRAQVATLSGFAVTGGTFNTYLGTLRRAEFIACQGNEVAITPAGLAYLGSAVPPAPATTAEVLAIWRGALRAGERRMLDALVAAYPGALSRAQLGAATEMTPTGGTFGTYLGTLRRNGLATVEGDEVRASPTLFLETEHAA